MPFLTAARLSDGKKKFQATVVTFKLILYGLCVCLSVCLSACDCDVGILAHSDCCFFAPCTNILTYLLTYFGYCG